MSELVAGCVLLVSWAGRGVAQVWGELRRLLGGRAVLVLALAYLAGSVVWAWLGFPGGPAVPVVLGSGYALLLMWAWVERRHMDRVEVLLRVEAEAKVDAEWREIRADAEWVAEGRPER